MAPSIALISGHTDLSEADFSRHYRLQLISALDQGHHFILGDAAGADAFALTYLLSPAVVLAHPDVKERITIYLSRKASIDRLQSQGLKVVPPDDRRLQAQQTDVVVSKKGRDSRRWHHVQRDAAMTTASDYDILYVRTEEESRKLYGAKYRPRVSATELNRLRRIEVDKRKAAAVGKGLGPSSWQ